MVKATFDSQEHPKKLNAYKEKSEKGKKDKNGVKKEESTQANKQIHKNENYTFLVFEKLYIFENYTFLVIVEKIQNQKHREKCNITKEYCKTKEIK